jgi:ppGpp synthetase/RelA/SpoT-type nucleotidyltranferase
MGEFVKAEFRNDPRVALIMVLHLLENPMGKSEIEVLTTRLKSQDLIMAKLCKDLDAVTSKVCTR